MIDKVIIKQCQEYDVDKIKTLILSSLEEIGFIVPTNKKILIKPNILGIYDPNQHVTTNPAIVEALVKIFQNNTLIIGDSSGNRSKKGTEKALEKTGMNSIGEKYNIKAISFDDYDMVEHKIDGKILKKVFLTKIVDEIDYIINIPKLKTHSLTGYTGAVKNNFGLVPGGIKQSYHAKGSCIEDFAELLVDIYESVKAKIILNVMDGIIGLEGFGPGPSGKQKHANMIAVSRNACALDHNVCQYIGAKTVLTDNACKNRELYDCEDIKERIKFKMPNVRMFGSFFNRCFSFFSIRKPMCDREKCIKCGICRDVCPKGVISMQPYPTFDYSKCIYCYCCHENCPEAAIEFEANFVFKTIKKIRRLFRK